MQERVRALVTDNLRDMCSGEEEQKNEVGQSFFSYFDITPDSSSSITPSSDKSPPSDLEFLKFLSDT